MSRKYLLVLLTILLLPILAACAGGTEPPAAEKQPVARPAGWSEETHGSDADPNYAVVFPQDKVNQLNIQVAPEDWAAMQTNMKELFGEAGQGGKFAGGMVRVEEPSEAGGADQAPAEGEEQALPPPDCTFEKDAAPPAGDVIIGKQPRPGEGPKMVRGGLNNDNPDWFEATISFEGKTWSNVGLRYKGNSSLVGSWHSGSLNLPFKLDFDQFEGEHPEIVDQRFYGFKQLSLSNNHGDGSFMREALTYELLAEAGLPSARTAFYELVMDYGEGPKSLGLYTVIEVVDDTLLGRVFEDDSGNIYEGDGPAASLAEGTLTEIPQSFEKENNEDSGWGEIEALYNVLHSPERTADPATWRAKLEAIFDVDVFLEWLALGAAINHWDTYGGMPHNYYLYNNPATGKLTWISWDHNFVLGGSGGAMRVKIDEDGGPVDEGGPIIRHFEGPAGDEEGPPPGLPPGECVIVGGPGEGDVIGGPAGDRPGGVRIGGGRPGGALDRSDVDDEWPLIRYLLDDPTYNQRYIAYLRETAESIFNAAAVAPRIERLAALVQPHAEKEGDQASFDAAVKELNERIAAQEKAVGEFLSSQK